MPSSEGYPPGLPDVLSAPVYSDVLDPRLDSVRTSVIDQLAALLAEDEPLVEAAITEQPLLEQLPAHEAILEPADHRESATLDHDVDRSEGAVELAESQPRGRLAGLGRRLRAAGQPAARLAGELATETLATANRALDAMEAQEAMRKAAVYDERTDIELQRANGSPDFGRSDLKYERRTGKPSPRRQLPPPVSGSD